MGSRGITVTMLTVADDIAFVYIDSLTDSTVKKIASRDITAIRIERRDLSEVFALLRRLLRSETTSYF